MSLLALWAQETKEKVTVDDVDRNFIVRLPRGYDAQQHYPVVILLHGMNQDADDMQRLTRFDALADKDGVITVYPIALHGRWNVGVRPQQQQSTIWARADEGMAAGTLAGDIQEAEGGIPGEAVDIREVAEADNRFRARSRIRIDRAAPADDIAFFNQMLDQLGTKFSVDSSRIYAAGLVGRRIHEHARWAAP